ncbi:MAG: hypothetical protein M1133_11730 [Armatimonadetes bacterium]|nr:hypothetical protein [Armatimonadota bacterium]
MFIDACKTENMLAFLEEEHFRHHWVAGAVPSADEVAITADWSVVMDATPSALLSKMQADFRTFMSKCMGVDLSSQVCGPRVVFGLSCDTPNRDESFKITADDDAIEITSAGERGLMHASHYLERQFALRGGPFAKKGITEISPAFDVRISNTVFCSPDGSIDDPIVFTDKYLGLMSHFGINGVHVYISIWDYCKNSIFPELNTPGYDANIAQLRNLCMRAGEHGIDVYLVVRNSPVDASIFDRCPEAQGATIDFPVPNEMHCLCTSNADVIACYQESFANLFREVPELGGAILIVGGEGFVHCFTRPKRKFGGKTDCPNCSDHNPSSDVASLINSIASSIHRISPDVKVFTWPYSAFVWSGDDFAQTEFISRLSDDVLLLSNFETPGKFTLNGQSAALLDYNIHGLGPSEQFKAQSEVLERRGKGHYAKIESSVDPGWFFLPYLPLHFRWAERIKRLRENRVPGVVSRWRFYGFTDCIPEELICEATWGQDVQPEKMLLDLARRDYGQISDTILEGWKRLSDLWGRVPSGHMMWGEREFYMKGPIYLGPAHPLVFDAQKSYNLIEKFYALRGDLSELCSEEDQLIIRKSALPRYSSDLLFTYPFGAEAVEEAFRSVVYEWEEATSIVADAIGSHPNIRAQMELNICRIIGIHLRTAWNVVRFYRERDALFSQPGGEDAFLARQDCLRAIADDEIANANNALAILESDIRIGYGHCYGQIYDSDMVRDKIRQCIYVRDTEIPNLKSGVLFHVYHKRP